MISSLICFSTFLRLSQASGWRFVIHQTRTARAFFLISMRKFVTFSLSLMHERRAPLGNDDGPSECILSTYLCAKCSVFVVDFSRSRVHFHSTQLQLSIFLHTRKPQLDIHEIHLGECGRNNKLSRLWTLAKPAELFVSRVIALRAIDIEKCLLSFDLRSPIAPNAQLESE